MANSIGKATFRAAYALQLDDVLTTRVIGNNLYASNITINSSDKTDFIGGQILFTGSASDYSTTIQNNSVNLDNVSAIGETKVNAAVLTERDPSQGSVADLSQNTIKIKNSSFENLFVAGALYTYDDTYIDSPTISTNATLNSVEVSNTSITGSDSSLYGAYVSQGTAQNNTVTIGENVFGHNNTVAEFDTVAGGYVSGQIKEDINSIKGNTLNLYSPIKTKQLQGFQQYNFFIKQADFEKNTPLIQVSGDKAVLLSSSSSDTSTKISVSGTGLNLKGGDTVTLIQSNMGFVNENDQQWVSGNDLSSMKTDLQVQNRTSLARLETSEIKADDYDLEITNGDKSLVITVSGEEPIDPPVYDVSDETNALMESSLSSLVTMFAADDLFMDTLIGSRNMSENGLFIATRAGLYSTESTGRLHNNVYSALMGISNQIGQTELGSFIELGHSTYETSFNSKEGDKIGNGRHNYAVVALFANHSLENYRINLTGYLKGGWINNDYSVTLAGIDTDFDRTSLYWGAHLGVNLTANLTEKLTSRLYMNYFYDGRESESYEESGDGSIDGTRFKYDSLGAHRVRFGSHFEYAYTSNLRPYFGLSVEQVFNAQSTGKAFDSKGTLSLNSSDVDGTTGIVSMGWNFQQPDRSFEFAFGVNGYAGVRNGINASLNAVWRY